MDRYLTLKQKQIREKVNQLTEVVIPVHPKDGWIRTIRNAFGMTARQLAGRMEISISRVLQLEKAEVSQTTTLKALNEAAQALGCRLEYVLIPHAEVETILHERALAMAEKKVAYIAHSMKLEDQEPSAGEQHRLIEELTQELLVNPKQLWED